MSILSRVRGPWTALVEQPTDNWFIQLFRYFFVGGFDSLVDLLGIGCIFVMVVGAQNNWGRLIVPTTPIWLLMAGQTEHFFSVKV